ncbi:MAG: DNA polymerase III subunit gamma/tau [Bacilli bacterium]|nr:DNA polymerase III subunit gamma/tau [Bacilli bacterium]
MYQALYRKYRPKDFDSVVGQTAIVQTLKNSIINHNFSHAYMFFGPRGTGKTTISKIFARNINCLDPKDGIACGKCEHCKVSFSKDCIDIIEIDAASNNGVDEIRELKNKISLVPSQLQYKVYIIDEVHMLSIGAFNALLKTLEEPPEHAIFILATTDPQKVPETIVSRCQCFSFKKISVDTIKEKLESVCKNEKIKIDDEVLENIAVLADGGLRDALGLLDKLVSYTDKKITMDDFISINGIISNKQLDEFIGYIMNGDIAKVLSSINEFDNNGKNLIQIISQILNYGRNIIVNYYLNNTKTPYDINKLQEFINRVNENMFDIKKSDNTRIFIEMFILKYMSEHTISSENVVVEKEKVEIKEEEKKEVVKEESKKDVVEETVEEDEEFDFSKEYEDTEEEVEDIPLKSTNSLVISMPQKILNIDEIMQVRVNNTLAKADKKLLKEEQSNFEKLKDFTFDQEIGYIVCSLLDSKLRAVSDKSMIISYELDSNVLQNIQVIEKIISVYNKITESDKEIAIISDSEWDKVKNEYIKNLKDGVKYEVKDEPEPIFEEIDKDDIISNSAVQLFGDIVVVE